MGWVYLSNCFLIHAYCKDSVFCPLHEHLFSTLIAVTKTSLINRLVVIGNRLRQILQENKSRPEPEFIDIETILLLQPLLHDIGKVLSIYQIKKNYYLHEFISGVIIYNLVKESNLWETFSLNKILLKILIHPVINHHYSMRDLYEKLGEKQSIEILRNSKIEFNKVSDVFDCLIEKLKLNEPYFSKIYSLVNKLNESAKNIGDIAIDRYTIKKYYSELIILNIEEKLIRRTVDIYISALTGIVNTADYLAASIERTGVVKATFIRSVLSNDEIEQIHKLIKPCKSMNQCV